MSIKLINTRAAHRRLHDIDEAVYKQSVLTHREGTLEQLGERIDNLAAIVGRLLATVAHGSGPLTDDAIADIIGGDWEVCDSQEGKS